MASNYAQFNLFNEILLRFEALDELLIKHIMIPHILPGRNNKCLEKLGILAKAIQLYERFYPEFTPKYFFPTKIKDTPKEIFPFWKSFMNTFRPIKPTDVKEFDNLPLAGLQLLFYISSGLATFGNDDDITIPLDYRPKYRSTCVTSIIESIRYDASIKDKLSIQDYFKRIMLGEIASIITKINELIDYYNKGEFIFPGIWKSKRAEDPSLSKYNAYAFTMPRISNSIYNSIRDPNLDELEKELKERENGLYGGGRRRYRKRRTIKHKRKHNRT